MTETHSFQAEVSRLLSLVANALYSDREVFLRELISNASDACDRLRYESQLHPGLLPPDTKLAITLIPNKEARTLTIADNGIGMNRPDLVANLGTIARSGTAEFLVQAAEAAQDARDANGTTPDLIGQFGVGFYSAFMVADKVDVLTHKAGESESWLWVSDGKGDFTIAPAEGSDLPHGTRITLHLKPEMDEFLTEERLKDIVTRYSDHIAFPIVIPGEGDLQKTLNSASALWLKPPKDITPEQYKEFYHHAGHAFDDPWLTLHWHAEGTIDYRALLFVPTTKPFDLMDPTRRNRLKLYVKRVFITEAVDGLLPPYLRFLRGIVDSEDLPLNISREMLQNNPVLDKIRSGLTKRVLGDLAKEAKNKDKAESYNTFWENFGAVLKEGLYVDRDHKDLILNLCRFHTTRTVEEDGQMIGLDDYMARMKEGQKEIYYIAGQDLTGLNAAPQLEGFRARGIEVLLLTDPADDFWAQSEMSFNEHKFVSATRGDIDLEKFPAAKDQTTPEAPPADMAKLIEMFKESLGEEVKDVRVSKRLTSSAVCLVAQEGDIDINLARLLRAHKQLPLGLSRVLEVNPTHPLIAQLGKLAEKDEQGGTVREVALLLLDQARILEGEPLPDPNAFANRMAALVSIGLDAA